MRENCVSPASEPFAILVSSLHSSYCSPDDASGSKPSLHLIRVWRLDATTGIELLVLLMRHAIGLFSNPFRASLLVFDFRTCKHTPMIVAAAPIIVAREAASVKES